MEKNNNHCKRLFKKVHEREDMKVVCANFFNFMYIGVYDIVILDPPYAYKLSNKIIKFLMDKNYINEKTLVIMRKSIDDVIKYEDYINVTFEYVYSHKEQQYLFFKFKK